MRTLWRMFVVAAVVVGVVSASPIYSISFTGTIQMTTADITNKEISLTAWCPGCNTTAQDTALSTVEPAGYNLAPSVVTGVSMSSLDAPNTTYTLVGYDIVVTSLISGNYTVTNAANASSNATGSAHLDSYTAVSLGGVPSPGLNNTGSQEPTNDLFYNPSNPNGYGYGPDPATSALGVNLAPGASTTVSFSNIGQTADLGCDFAPPSPTPPCANYKAITNSLGNVTTTNGPNDALAFYFSTLTEIDSSLVNGNASITPSTQVKERVTVTYDYTTADPVVPEPMTMVLMGGALVGLGLIGKRLKKS